MSENSLDRALSKALSFDPLAEAERQTGRSYKDDNATAFVGMLNMFDNNASRDALLSLANDTRFSMRLDEYLGVVALEGFREVLRVPFHDDKFNQDDALIVMWSDEGILLVFDTYGANVNGGEFYYNWRPREGVEWGHLTSSGCMEVPGVWVGDHDCREALRFYIRQLRENGQFLPQWEKCAFNWLAHYADFREAEGDQRCYDERFAEYDRRTAERVAMLPPEVQRAIAYVKTPRPRKARR